MEPPIKSSIHYHRLTFRILVAMGSGLIIGLILKYLSHLDPVNVYVVDGVLKIIGNVFLSLMKMVVVPIVFVSLVCGVCNLDDIKKLGRVGGKTLGLYVFTTALAITLAITIASLLHIGSGSHLTTTQTFKLGDKPSLVQTIINIFPTNPIDAMAKGNMLQVIVFAILLGMAISMAGEHGKHVQKFFNSLNDVVMQLVTILMKVTPIGVFCLIAAIFAKVGYHLILELLGYFCAVLLVLLIHLFVSNSLLLRVLAKLSPFRFFNKMFSAMLFAFSTSSSNASIPVVLNTVENKLGVKKRVSAFVIPLGATINMDGTAIMQGVATVFIANAYAIHIGLTGYLTVILTATLASIGTAGVPGVGLITLAMVLQQVGLPVEGIALIIGVDRLLDMTRTAVNITGDSAIACVVGKSEGAMELDTFYKKLEK